MCPCLPALDTSSMLRYMQVVEEKEERELRVPLPPSFGYQLNESDDEEEEGPPGMLPMKMPPMQKKVTTELKGTASRNQFGF